jgi:glycosyltransferase involved in cell wall biosynthesis
MNVVMIGPFALQPKGTTSARAFPLARALAQRGHRVTILIPPYDNPDEAGRAWVEDGVRLENLVVRRDDTVHRLRVPLQMARRVSALGADVVHVFKPTGYSGLAGFHLRRFSGRPLVLDTDDWEGTGGWADVNDYGAARRHFVDWQERWLARHADAVTVASRTLETQVWSFGVDPARVFYLPNGPDEALRDKAPLTNTQKAGFRAALGMGDAPLALYLGHVPRGADLDAAIDALALLGDDLSSARLAILGPGDGVPALQRHAEQAQLADRVLFHPHWIEPDEAWRYVAAADAIIAPYRDTLINQAKCPAKVVTAMALGKAVVTSRVGQNVAYVEDGRSGLLTEPGDAQDLARALGAVLRDRALAAELGRNAQQRVWAHFNWQAGAATAERAYRLAVEGDAT